MRGMANERAPWLKDGNAMPVTSENPELNFHTFRLKDVATVHLDRDGIPSRHLTLPRGKWQVAVFYDDQEIASVTYLGMV